MPKVTSETILPVSPSEIWRMIGEFNALAQWHPGVAKSVLEEGGKIRRLSLVGGGEIVELLESHDDGGKTYSYSIVESPLPVKNYHATLKVEQNAEGRSQITWSSDFDPVGSSEEALKTIQGMYQAGFDNLKKIFSQ